MQEQVFGLPVHLASVWIFNCYIVEGDGDSVTVIDPGLPSVTKEAVGAIFSSGRSVHDVAGITCSHGHPDHMGGMEDFARLGSGTFLLPAKCEDYLAGEQPRAFGPDNMLRFLPVLGEQRFSASALLELGRAARTIGFRGPQPFVFPLVTSGFLGHGEPLPHAAGWEVISTPGHSDESICFYHRDSETLISGDAVVTHDGRAWFNPERVDETLSAQTEEMLRALPVSHLLPGHGRPVSGDVWGDARSFNEMPEGNGFLSRCARRLGSWG